MSQSQQLQVNVSNPSTFYTAQPQKQIRMLLLL